MSGTAEVKGLGKTGGWNLERSARSVGVSIGPVVLYPVV